MSEINRPQKIVIRGDGFLTSRPWCADVYWPDGTLWKSWSYGFKSLKALNDHLDELSLLNGVVREEA